MARLADPQARNRLLAAAQAAFAARGLDATKVEDITAEAGLSKGAFYLHFPSKEEAFRELVEALVGGLEKMLEARGPGCLPEFPTLQAFLDFWIAKDVEMFEFIWKNRAVVGTLLQGGQCAGYRHLIDEFADRASGHTRALLERGVKLGLYRSDIDTEATAAFIGGAYDRLARLTVKARRKPDLLAHVRAFQRIILRGIATGPLRVYLEQQGAVHAA